MSKLGLKGTYKLVHKKADGTIISEEEICNLITNQGKDAVLNYALNNATSVAAWYFAIYSGTYTPAAGSVYATPGGTENTNYTEATRQVWGEGVSSSQSVTNATAATITADTGGIVVTGIGTVGSPSGSANASTKGDVTAGDNVLLSEVTVSKTLAETETLDITYTVDA